MPVVKRGACGMLNQALSAHVGHMVLVSTNPGAQNGAIGVITLEDVIEELIGEEIVDETDVYVDGNQIRRDLIPCLSNTVNLYIQL